MEHLQPKQQRKEKSIRLVVDLFVAIVCAVIFATTLCPNVNAQLINPTLVHPTIQQGIPNGNGYQIGVANPGCATTAVVGNCCSNTITWPIPFIDANVNQFCQCTIPQSGVPIVIPAGAGATSSTVETCTLEAVASACAVILCWGSHQ